MKIGIDTGFGHTKYALYDNQKALILGKFPSVVAQVDGVKDKEDDTHIFENKLWYIGDLALKQNHRNIKELVTYKALETFSPLLIAEVLRLENIEPKEIESIGLGLSPAHKDNIESFKYSLKKFEVDEKEYNFKNLSLFPQGVAAVNAIKSYWATQKFVEPTDYITIDIGFNTMDVVIVYNRKIVQSSIGKNNSFEKRGVINIAQSVQNHIKKEFEEEITLKESLAIVLNQKYRLRGETHELKDFVDNVKMNYTIEIMDFLEQKYKNEFDKLEAVCFVGGGGYFIDTKYAPHIQTFKSSEYYNAIGNLLMLK